MGQLPLDHIVHETALLVQHRACQRSEAVPRHFAAVAHAVQHLQHRAVVDRLVGHQGRLQHVHTASVQRLERLQHRQHLRRQRHDVRLAVFHAHRWHHPDALAAQVAAIPKVSNRNVDEQHGLGLVSTLAQDAREQTRTEEATQRDIETLQNRAAIETSRAQASACYDTLIDFIYDCTADKASSLLPVELLRRWLQQYIEMWEAADLAVVLDIPPKDINASFADYELVCRLRIGRADEADIYRYMAAIMLRSEVNSNHIEAETLLLNTFASAHEIDLEPVRQEAADQVKAETKAKIAAINKQIKAAKTTFTPLPAGAAIDTGEADAKKPKPAASRKAKTTAQEAISGIAAAMQSIEAAPLGAALGGAEAAAASNGVCVNQLVEVQFGRHFGKTGTVTNIVCDNMFDVRISNGTLVRLSGHQFEKVQA